MRQRGACKNNLWKYGSDHHARRRSVVTSRANLAYFKPETGVPQGEEPRPQKDMMWANNSRLSA
jgi:hypothetical protein